MRFGTVPIDEALGTILAHQLVDQFGTMLLNKGRVLTESDLDKLRAADIEQIVVARLAETDVHENVAAKRVGTALAGKYVKVTAPGVGRANLQAETRGTLRIHVAALAQLNNIHEGITIATVREHTLVNPGDLIALVKIIPFGIPQAAVIDVECMAAEHSPILTVRPLVKRSVGLIISGPESARDKLIASFHAPVRHRIENLGCELNEPLYVAHTPEGVADGLQSQAHCDLLIVASISAIIDRGDVVPAALELAGGHVTHYGVPVDPGSLLMLGYLGEVPVIGAPGCIKSPKTNVIDWILPRLIAGERLTRADLVVMGHGGLLEDIRDRPMPREVE